MLEHRAHVVQAFTNNMNDVAFPLQASSGHHRRHHVMQRAAACRVIVDVIGGDDRKAEFTASPLPALQMALIIRLKM